MKQLIPCILLFVLPCMPIAAPDTEEARLLDEIRRTSGEEQGLLYIHLADHRESKGELGKAIDTWGILKKTHGKEQAWNESSAPNHTYAQLADFHIQRIKRVQNLLANPPKPPSLQLRKALTEAMRAYQEESGNDFLSAPVDMDGDLIPEMFVARGKGRELGKPADMVLLVFKWDGKRYREAFRWQGEYQLGHAEQPHFRIIDDKGWGMYEIEVGFVPETDDGAPIQSNGQKIIFAY